MKLNTRYQIQESFLLSCKIVTSSSASRMYIIALAKILVEALFRSHFLFRTAWSVFNTDSSLRSSFLVSEQQGLPYVVRNNCQTSNPSHLNSHCSQSVWSMISLMHTCKRWVEGDSCALAKPINCNCGPWILPVWLLCVCLCMSLQS